MEEVNNETIINAEENITGGTDEYEIQPVPVSPVEADSLTPATSPTDNILGLGSSIINKPEDSRPQISGYDISGDKYISRFETENRNKLLREYKYKPPETIMSLRLEQIVENMVNYVVSFMENYNGKLYEVDLEYKLMGEEQTFFSKVKRYYLAFILHLQDKDNKLYFGIVLLTMSIILYLFNITR